MDRVTISVDVRERRSGLPSLLTDLGLRVELDTLDVGDYAVEGRVLERKTVADLHHSLAQGRLWRQVGALRRDPRRAYLIVEGQALDAGPIPERAVRGALLKVFDNGVRVLRATSPRDTAVWLDVLARQDSVRRRGLTAPHLRQHRHIVSPVGVVAAIPGIGIGQARALLAEFGSIGALAQASEEDLRSISGVGPIRARLLLQTLSSDTERPV